MKSNMASLELGCTEGVIRGGRDARVAKVPNNNPFHDEMNKSKKRQRPRPQSAEHSMNLIASFAESPNLPEVDSNTVGRAI